MFFNCFLFFYSKKYLLLSEFFFWIVVGLENPWTKNIEKAKELSKEIDSGAVFINGLVKSDPRLPFGGVKTSGYGRELAHYGIKEFVNIKTVWIK